MRKALRSRTKVAPLSHRRAEAALRKHALAFPDAAPWGKRFIRVRGKIFISIGIVDDTLRVGVKLPRSAEMALTLPFCEPGGRRLGPAGWITAHFRQADRPPVALLKGWAAQSYYATAPKSLQPQEATDP